jgi:hypothetical protein
MWNKALRAFAWLAALLIAGWFLRPVRLLVAPGAPQKFSPPDLMQFYFAGQLAASGRVAGLYQRQAYKPLIAHMRAQGERVGAYPFNRPAFAAFLCIPLTWVPYRTALLLTALGNIVLLALLVWKLPAWSSQPVWLRVPLAVFLPLLLTIVIAQDTLLLALLVAWGLRLAARGKDTAGGIVLALCAVKPHLIWALPLALLAAGKWRMLRAFAGAGAALALASFAAVGPGGVRDWIELLQAPSTDYRPETMANVRALAIHFGTPAGVAATLFVLACAAIILRRGRFEEKLAACLMASLLLNPHTYLYDLSLLAVAAFWPGAPVGYAALLPWPYLYGRDDMLAWIFLMLAGLGAASARLVNRSARQETLPWDAAPIASKRL